MKFRDIAPRLFENGWRSVIPLTHAKGTHVKWGELQRRDMTEATLAHFIKHHGDAPRTGLVFGPERGIVAIDVDVMDEETNALICDIAADTLGLTPFLRIGKSPKFMAFYSGTVRSRKAHPVEVFGSSGQAAIFGPHPSTGRPYWWPVGSPLDCCPKCPPEVTQAEVDEFLSLCKRHVQLPRTPAAKTEWTDEDEVRRELRLGGVDAAARLIMGVSKGNRHLTLLHVTAWLVAKGYTPGEIAVFVDEFFPAHLRSKEWAQPGAEAAKMAASAAGKFCSNTEYGNG